MTSSYIVATAIGELDSVQVDVSDTRKSTVSLFVTINRLDSIGLSFHSIDALQSFVDRCQNAIQDYNEEIGEVTEMTME
jgi:hypothetical protein